MRDNIIYEKPITVNGKPAIERLVRYTGNLIGEGDTVFLHDGTKGVITEMKHSQTDNIRIDGKPFNRWQIASFIIIDTDDEDDFSCHYCGMPAVGFDFFDAPVCRECGGR